MPHVVLTGQITLADRFDKISPVLDKQDGTILKTTAAYLAQDRGSVLLEALTIEQGLKQAFFILVGQRQDGLVVRLHPSADGIEKTGAVKQLLALVAAQLHRLAPYLSVGETNLDPYLATAGLG